MSNTIAIFSTKGGVGKTFLAANLAVALAQTEQKRVLAIDLDLQVAGDMAKMLDLAPSKTIADLMGLLKSHPEQVSRKDFLTHSKFGIDFLSAITNPQQAPHINSVSIKDVFALYAPDYDYIVVDAGKNFCDSLVHTLNQANLIILAVTPDTLSVHQTKWALDTLQFLHFPLSMIKLVLNRAKSISSISWQEINVALGCNILALIPSEGRVVMQSVNSGVPVVIDKPKSAVSQEINKLAQQLVTQQNLFLEHDGKNILAKDSLEEFPANNAIDFWKTSGLVADLKAQDKTEEEIDELLKFKHKIHERLIDELNLKRMDLRIFSDAKKSKDLKDRAEKLIGQLLVEEGGSFVASMETRKKLVKEILDEVLGFGPLEDFLKDADITDIMVNNKDEIYIERFGKIEPTTRKFLSNEQVRTIIERIIAPIGRHIDESTPMVDARLQDGSRVNAVIPPLSLTGPTLTIRKFRKERYSIDELVGMNTLSHAMSKFLQAAVLSRQDTIVSGGTGSGKTTVLNVLSAFIPEGERIVTIEDAAELRLHQRHWVRLESRPPNIEGKGGVGIRELFRNTLRMRPDRILIGECRGVETLDMLQAMNTGHDGSMTTLHANSPHDALVRLDSMILMAGIELPLRAIREMIASAIDIIIHTARLSDGSRKILQITEIVGMKDDTHVDLRDVFVFHQTGIGDQGKIIGEFRPTGYIPSFFEEIKIKGIPISEDLFKT